MRLRVAYVTVYGGLVALGAALLARPAELWLDGLGLLAPTIPWEVPAGWAAAGLLVAHVAAAARLAAALAARRPLPTAAHAALLVTVAGAVALRSAGEPVRPRSPEPALLAALRASAEALDAAYAATQRYDARAVQRAIATLPPPGFVFRGRVLPLVVRVGLDADRPGTIIVTISPDAQHASLSATTLRNGAVALLRATVEAHAGAHSAPGGDAAFPVYPRRVAQTP